MSNVSEKSLDIFVDEKICANYDILSKRLTLYKGWDETSNHTARICVSLYFLTGGIELTNEELHNSTQQDVIHGIIIVKQY